MIWAGDYARRAVSQIRVGGVILLTAGRRLRALREELGLTMRDVEAASERIATRRGNQDFTLPLSRLSDIEAKGLLPSLHRLYSLSVIYRRDMRELLAWFGIDVNEVAADVALVSPPESHITDCQRSVLAINVPIRMDPGFDARRTANLGRMIECWGLIPIAYLSKFANTKFTYGYIGSEDLTMYPLLPPGSFIQVDESVKTVTAGSWRSEYERPIYFVETREGYTACWCELKGDLLILQPHPLSPVDVRMLKHTQDAKVVGRVVGMAMHLDGRQPSPIAEVTAGPQASKAPQRSN